MMTPAIWWDMFIDPHNQLWRMKPEIMLQVLLWRYLMSLPEHVPGHLPLSYNYVGAN